MTNIILYYFNDWNAYEDDVIDFNPRPSRGLMRPPEFFRDAPLNYEADRAEILHSWWGIRCANWDKLEWWKQHHRCVQADDTDWLIYQHDLFRSGHTLTLDQILTSPLIVKEYSFDACPRADPGSSERGGQMHIRFSLEWGPQNLTCPQVIFSPRISTTIF